MCLLDEAMETDRGIEFDVVIVGSGIAGLFTALRCSQKGLDVLVVTKSKIKSSSTNWAQGGIAAVLDTEDEEAIESHVNDTLSCGKGLCDEQVVRSVVKEAARRISDLVAYGVGFDRDSDGYHKAIEGGHSEARILHSQDRTGAEIEYALEKATSDKGYQKLKINEGWMAIDIIQVEYGSPSSGACGVWCLRPDGVVVTIRANAVILATGGCGMLYNSTTNPSVATGDGVAMAQRFGADIEDMEFIQFHPTSLYGVEVPFLITEAMRGHGAILMTKEEHRKWRNDGGDPADWSYMKRHSELGSLDTRDVVARATDQQLKISGENHVLLVTEHLDVDDLREQFPTICQRLEENGLNFGPDPIPVRPAAHYLVGGVSVDQHGRCLVDKQPISGLYAIGETARTGLHGANRLASNSLLEAVVFAERCSKHVADNAPKKMNGGLLPSWRGEGLSRLIEHAPLGTDLSALRNTMTRDVGLVKSFSRLMRGKRMITHLKEEFDEIWSSSLPSRELVELRNMIVCAGLVIEASIARDFNVGLHYNIDLSGSHI